MQDLIYEALEFYKVNVLQKSETQKLIDAGQDVYNHHSGFVNTVALSSDGTRIASGSSDKSVHMWLAS